MILNVKNLEVRFKRGDEVVKAVDRISFEVNEDEVVGLVGESGSGKTVTALSIMKLLLAKNCLVTGEITSAKKAIIFQEPFTSLNPVLKVGEQIDEAILIHEKRITAKEKTLSLLGKVKFSDPNRIYDSYPHILSGGERQRAMIAMALALRPELLIADEPTTALDVTTQSEILDLILGLKKDFGMAVLFITHDFGIINKIADRVLVMKNGKIIERGEKREILSSPKEDYTKRLLEAVPRISTIRGQVSTFDKKLINRFVECRDLTPTAIAVRNLNKAFPIEKGIFKEKKGMLRAVQNVNLEIKEGRTLGIVGESGSGKTTLGKLLMGLIEPDSGHIFGLDKKLTQIVFQDPHSSLDPRMRMGDIILEGPTVKGASRKRKDSILRDVLFKVRLKYEDRLKYPHQFSGGEKQRIAIARALAVSPKVLILDEPVSSLDVIIQKEILELLKELQRELSLTYLFISHDLRVVAYMASEVCVMRKGEIVEFATRDEIYSSPRHLYTKQLLSSVLQLA